MTRYFWLFFISVSLLGQEFKVVRVIDGDTFESSGGEIIRLIGINTPEKNDIFFEESKEHLENYILNKNVTLVKDYYSSNRDRNGRLLRYVYLENTDVNLKMISDGYAFAYLKYKFGKANNYRQEQLNANASGKGIWEKVNIGISETKNLSSNEKIKPSQTNYLLFEKKTIKALTLFLIILILVSIGIFYIIKK